MYVCVTEWGFKVCIVWILTYKHLSRKKRAVWRLPLLGFESRCNGRKSSLCVSSSCNLRGLKLGWWRQESTIACHSRHQVWVNIPTCAHTQACMHVCTRRDHSSSCSLFLKWDKWSQKSHHVTLVLKEKSNMINSIWCGGNIRCLWEHKSGRRVLMTGP